MNRLCEIADVQRVIDTVGRWTNTEVNTEIEYQTEDIYDNLGRPLSCTSTDIGLNSADSTFYKEYSVGEANIYDVDRIFVGTTTKRELIASTDYSVSKNMGMIKLASSVVGGYVLNAADEMIIHYVPRMFSQYCAICTAEALLEKVDIITSGVASKELAAVRTKKARLEEQMNKNLGIVFASSYINFDTVYPNLKEVAQDFDKNKYLWKVD